MQFINPEQAHIKKALEVHKDKLLPILNARINESKHVVLKPFLKKNIEQILIGSPSDLIKLQDTLFKQLPKFKVYLKEKRNTKNYCKSIRRVYSKYLTELLRIIDYDTFSNKKKNSDYDTYRLAQNLNINTCTYCNRLYTKTVVNTIDKGKVVKLTRPTFDHWFPQSKNPLLGLSFYNLIPSCTVCNSSLKGSVDMTLDQYLHPYIDCDINFQFSYKLKAIDQNEFTITNIGDDLNSRSKNTSDFFKLKEIYETHLDEIDDLVKIKKAYSVTYLKNLKDLFMESNQLSNEEIYRLAFGTEINELKFDRRPLSRMKRDLLIELGIIRK
ncbi:hypothetical protein [Arenibacter echinorum]|uniref:HNH endonuclease n=1 Tax=Arenibacter echinorum TaxID=440515 RepID=A0A327R4H0_9FLAO|nr:hypothetical protein [Arenibacter echinorum]RAJ11709.1 hypothetical protein LV92_02641 [Arenibacter echinorum]